MLTVTSDWNPSRRSFTSQGSARSPSRTSDRSTRAQARRAQCPAGLGCNAQAITDPDWTSQQSFHCQKRAPSNGT